MAYEASKSLRLSNKYETRRGAGAEILKLLSDGKEWKTADIHRIVEKKGCTYKAVSVALSHCKGRKEIKQVAPATYMITNTPTKSFRQTVNNLLDKKFINDHVSVVDAVKKYCRTHNHKPVARITAMMALSNFSPSAVSAAFPAGVKAGWLERVSRGTYRWKDKNAQRIEEQPAVQEKIHEEESINVRDAVILLNQAKRYMVNKESPEYHLAALAGLYLQGKMK